MRKILALFSLLVLCASLSVSSAQSTDFDSARHQFRAVPVVEGLENMWSMAFLPNGDMLVTERPGRLRVIRNGELLEDSVSGMPEVFARGQGGLLDVVLHPQFESNSLVYFSYSHPNDGSSTTAVARGRFDGSAVHDVEEIFVANSSGRGHYGSRLVFDNDGYLYVTVGDRQASPSGDLESHPSQDTSNHHGTVNRIHDDGSIPSDNPFVGVEGVEPSIWSYGHRNQQGMTMHPETGAIWAIEHGPQGGDELNLIVAGSNYGWPVIGYGINYNDDIIHSATHQDGMAQPAHYWVPSIATSGLLIYDGNQFPNWNGNAFVGGLNGQQLARLTMDGESIVSEETLLSGMGRIRDVRQSPDGYIYIGIDSASEDTASILRLEPADAN